jgi:hypothetical protein
VQCNFYGAIGFRLLLMDGYWTTVDKIFCLFGKNLDKEISMFVFLIYHCDWSVQRRVGADWSVSYSGLLAVPASDNVFQ